MKLEHSNTIYKNKLKIDQRPKCKTIFYKTLRGKYRQNTLWHKAQKFWGDQSPTLMEIKAKVNKQTLIKCESFCTAKKTINKTKI